MKLHRILYSILLVGFLLGIHEGRIALWKGEDPEPAKVFPFQASMLPEADQRRLEAGIRVENFGDLAKLMEDYLS